MLPKLCTCAYFMTFVGFGFSPYQYIAAILKLYFVLKLEAVA